MPNNSLEDLLQEAGLYLHDLEANPLQIPLESLSIRIYTSSPRTQSTSALVGVFISLLSPKY